ncbi:MAG: hypothetical protein ACSHWU_02765 [Marinicella sp.]
MKTFVLTFIFLFSLSANAMNINANGTGQVLLVPYYSVQNNLNTLLSITNTTNQVKAMKVKFLEGRFGHEVFVLNVYLGPHDIWTAGLIPAESHFAGHLGEPSTEIISNDESCVPYFESGVNGQFFPYLLDAELVNTSLNRAQEGMIQVFEMGVIDSSSAMGQLVTDRQCTQLVEAWENGAWALDAQYNLSPASGGLKVSASIVDVDTGVDYVIEPVAIDGFFSAESIIHTEPGELRPNLTDGDDKSVLIHSGQATISHWQNSAEAVSALLMRSQLFNEFELDQAIGAITDWVVTFPTKKHFIDPSLTVAQQPFNQLYDADLGACENLFKNNISLFDRASKGGVLDQIILDDCTVTPPPPMCDQDVSILSLCASTNVIAFNGQSGQGILSSHSHDQEIFNSVLLDFMTETETTNGFVELDFGDYFMDSLTSDGTVSQRYYGLPVMGFAVQKFTNSNAQPGLLADYGGATKHAYSTRIESL